MYFASKIVFAYTNFVSKYKLYYYFLSKEKFLFPTLFKVIHMEVIFSLKK